MKLRRDSTIVMASYLYIFTLCTYGFFKRFLSINIITDITGFLLILGTILFTRDKVALSSSEKQFYSVVTIFCVMTGFVSIISMHSLDTSLLGFRNYVFYIVFGVMVSRLRKEDSYRKIMTFIARIGTLVCLFGVVQFVFFNRLPESLMTYVGAVKEYVYGLGLIIPFRINGLLENTIVFGNFAIIIAITLFAKLFVFGKTPIDVVSAAVVVASVLLTFGRVAIVGSVLGIIFAYFFCSKKETFSFTFKVVVILLVVVFFALGYTGDSILITRLLGRGESTIVSNTIHAAKSAEGFAILKKNWLLGVGMGTQGYTRGNIRAIVPDGGWLSMALELGIPTISVMAVFFVRYIVWALRKRLKRNNLVEIWVTASSVSGLIILMGSSLFNSAYTARANYGLSWILIGLSFGIDRVVQTQRRINEPLW